MENLNTNEPIKRVGFQSEVDIQIYSKTKPVSSIKRHLPSCKYIIQAPLKSSPTSHLTNLFTLARNINKCKQGLLTDSTCTAQIDVNLTSIRQPVKIKNKKLNKRIVKIKHREIKASAKIQRSIKLEPNLTIKKYSKQSFKPEPQPFDNLLNQHWDVISVFSILSFNLKWCKKYKDTPRFMLFQVAEKALIKLCTPNMMEYIKTTNMREDKLAVFDGIVLERLRGASPSHNDLTGRVYLAPQLPLSRLIMRTIHKLFCGNSSRFQRSIAFRLGYNLGKCKPYFKFLSEEKCQDCIRRRAEAQVNQAAPIPRSTCLFTKPYNVVSCDLSYHNYHRQGKWKTPIMICHFLCLQTTHCFSIPQKSTSGQEFLNSILQLISFCGSSPSMIIVDQGSDFKSISRKIQQLESDFGEHSETRAATKRKINFKDFILAFTDREKAKLKAILGKLSCMLLFHPANSSFLTACENLISQFRTNWAKCKYNKITLDVFQFHTCVKLTDMSLNKQPLFLIRQDDFECYELSAQDLFNGRISNFQGQQVANLHPLTAHSALSELSFLGKTAKQSFEILHSERYQKLSTFYKDNKNPQYTKLLKRPLMEGDICLFSQRNSKILKLCVINALSAPGIPDYSQSSEVEIAFLPQNYSKVQDNLSSIWKRDTKRVHISTVAPILAREQRYLDFTVLPDHPVPSKNLEDLNSQIKKLNANNPTPNSWSKLLSRDILTAPLSRILINEKDEGKSDPYYTDSRRVLNGLEQQKPFPKLGATPNDILKNALPSFETPVSKEPASSTLDQGASTENISRPPTLKIARKPKSTKLTPGPSQNDRTSDIQTESIGSKKATEPVLKPRRSSRTKGAVKHYPK